MQAGVEVDFVFKGKYAFEVKSNTWLFKKNKYKLFFKNYSQIKFSLVSWERAGEKNILFGSHGGYKAVVNEIWNFILEIGKGNINKDFLLPLPLSLASLPLFPSL